MLTCETRRAAAVDRAGWVVATPRTVAAQARSTRSAAPGAEPDPGSAGAMWDLVRAAYRDSVGVHASGARVRVRDDVLATAGGMEPGRGVAAVARVAAR